jgi:Flp pilus assembly protein CpaB
LANSPSCSATKNPAESMAGTTPTFSVVFSGGPKLVGRVLVSEALAVELLPEDEQPAASAATAASAAAHAAVRLQLRMPVNGNPSLS